MGLGMFPPQRQSFCLPGNILRTRGGGEMLPFSLPYNLCSCPQPPVDVDDLGLAEGGILEPYVGKPDWLIEQGISKQSKND